MAASLSSKLEFISSQARPDGRDLLREVIGWSEFDEEDEPQKSIHLDCLHDNLMYMVKKGFQWNEIAILFVLFQAVLTDCKGKTINDVIKYFTVKIQSVSDNLSATTLKQYTDFFFFSYMRHFKLYQLVFNEDQVEMRIKTELQVDIPPDPVPPFPDGKTVDVYEYEKIFTKLEQEEEELLKQHEQKLQDVKLQSAGMLKHITESVGESSLTREELKKIIHEVASKHISAASAAITTEIQNTMEDLNIKLEKTALPRPEALGQPPRYKPKPAIQVTSAGGNRTSISRDTAKSNALATRQSRQSSRTSKR